VWHLCMLNCIMENNELFWTDWFAVAGSLLVGGSSPAGFPGPLVVVSFLRGSFLPGGPLVEFPPVVGPVARWSFWFLCDGGHWLVVVNWLMVNWLMRYDVQD